MGQVQSLDPMASMGEMLVKGANHVLLVSVDPSCPPERASVPVVSFVSLTRLREAFVPPPILHRLWLFCWCRVNGKLKELEKAKWDLDAMFQIPASLQLFDPLAETSPLKQASSLKEEEDDDDGGDDEKGMDEDDEDADVASVLGGVNQTTAIISRSARRGMTRVQRYFAAWDAFEEAARRYIALSQLRDVLLYLLKPDAEELTFALLQHQGRMYPSRVTRLVEEMSVAMPSEGPIHLEPVMAAFKASKHPHHSLSFKKWSALGRHDKRGVHSLARKVENKIDKVVKAKSTTAPTVDAPDEPNSQDGFPFASVFGLVPFFKSTADVYNATSRHEAKGVTVVIYTTNALLGGGTDVFKVKFHRSRLRLALGNLEYRDMDGELQEVITLSNATVLTFRLHPRSVKILTREGRAYKFVYASTVEAAFWANILRQDATAVVASASSFRFTSFAPEITSPQRAQFYVDGKDYYEAAYEALIAARTEVLIADWSFQPELYLKRGVGASPEQRLDRILKKLSNNGVRVFIMLWWQTKVGVGGSVRSDWVEEVFKDSPNICVLRHPFNNVAFPWTHHQKFIVVDGSLAFVGGLDLCFGRFDDSNHRLVDNNHLFVRHPGRDFYNPGLINQTDLHLPYTDHIDRDNVTRMPWHDNHCGVFGPVAGQVRRNFVERWNGHVSSINTVVGVNKYGTMALDVDKEAVETMEANFQAFLSSASPIKAQCVRSLSLWSGSPDTESSILNSYYHLIQASQLYIYLESQFFISSVGAARNLVAEKLVDRVVRAVKEKAEFAVVITLPLHPEGSFEQSTPRIVLSWQQRTIEGMRSRFSQQCPDSSFERYFSFHTVLAHDLLNDTPRIGMIYVHSKLLLVDDAMAVIGSANCNDRSLIGDRDSEIALVLESCGDLTLPNGFVCSALIHKWRTQLFAEHSGAAASELTDPLVACRILRERSTINRQLLLPVVLLNPLHVFRASSEPLPPYVDSNLVASSLREWFSRRDDERVCACCKQALAPGQEAPCNDCGEIVCIKCRGDAEICHTCTPLGRCPFRHTGAQSITFLQSSSNNSAPVILSALEEAGIRATPEAVAFFTFDSQVQEGLFTNVTTTRLNAIQGHIFPYPTEYRPHLKADILRVAPDDLFT